MGCTASNDQVDSKPTRKPSPRAIPTSPTPVEEKNIFIGVAPNLVLLCRDEFQSKYTEELMYRWRPAEILKVEGDNRNKVLVHYTGWADTFDHWVDLEVDFTKLAPENLLSKDQCNRGGALNEEQAEISRDFFLKGKEYTPHQESSSIKEPTFSKSMSNSEDATQKAIETALNVVRLPVIPAVALLTPPGIADTSGPVIAKRRSSANHAVQGPRPPSSEDLLSDATVATAPVSSVESNTMAQAPFAPSTIAQTGTGTVPQIPHSASKRLLAPVRLKTPSTNPYSCGEKVDVLDIFYKKGSSIPSQKWRSSEIVEVVGEYVTIHYLSWDDKYNERLHFAKDAHRLGPCGSHVQPKVKSGTSISVNSGGSTRNTRSNENMLSKESTSSTSTGGALNGNSHDGPVPSFPPAQAGNTVVQNSSRPPSGLGEHVGSRRLSHQDEGTELDNKGASDPVRRVQSVPAPSIPPIVTPPPQQVVRSTSTDKPVEKAVAVSGNTDLTPEQRNFTRNFYNYKKKKQAEVLAIEATIPEDSEPAEETKKKDTVINASELPDKSGFRMNLSKMTFGGLFGSAKDGSLLASKSASPRSINKSTSGASEEGAEPAAAEAVPVEDERNEEEIAARERAFLERLEARGLHVFAIEGDGNCLFRAVSHQLYLEQDMHDELRARCVEHLIRHRKRFEVFCEGDFDEHLKEMSKSGTWGDDLEIRALEEITDRVIMIYSSNVENVEEPLNNNFEEKNLLQGVPPLTLSYHGQSHYNSIYDENFPLPLVERKSRLLLRSRLALTQQDLLPSLITGSQSSDGTSSRHGSPRVSTGKHSQNYIARASSSNSSSLVTHINNSSSTAYDEPYTALTHPYQHQHAQMQMHPGHPPQHPSYGFHPEYQSHGHGQYLDADTEGYIGSTSQDYYDPNYDPNYDPRYDPNFEQGVVYEQSGYDPAAYGHVVYEQAGAFDPHAYEGEYLQPELLPVPANQYMYNNGYPVHHNQHQQHQNFNYGYQQKYHSNNGY